METLKVNHLNFDPKRLIKTQLETKQSKPRPNPERPQDPPQSVTYNELALMYEYDTVDAGGNPCRVIAPLQVEGPVLTSPVGIGIKPGQNGGENASIFTQFDMTNTEVAAFVALGDEKGDGAGFWERLYRACLHRIFEIRGEVKSLGRITKIEGLEGVFGYPIFWKRDSLGQIMPGTNPSKYFNLINYGKPGSFQRKETLFNIPVRDEKDPGTPENPNWKKLDWKLLTSGVEMKFQPLITFKKIYIGGGKASLQFEIKSAMVTHVVRANTVSGQKDTLEKASRDENTVRSIMQQVEALTRAFSDSVTLQEKAADKEKEKTADKEKEKAVEKEKAAVREDAQALANAFGGAPTDAKPLPLPAAAAPATPLPTARTGLPATIPGLPSASPGLTATLGAGGPTFAGVPGLPQVRT